MKILPMNEYHVAQVAELEKLCFSDPWSENSVASELKNPLSLWLIAEEDGVVCGYVGSQMCSCLAELCRQADILVSAAGVPGLITKDCVRPGQVLLDVSMNWAAMQPNARGSLGRFVGDAVFEEVAPVVEAISPVPGGVGGVTSAVLMRHTLEAAERSLHGR